MEILFKNKKLRKTCEQQVVARQLLGDVCAGKLKIRLSDLEAASCVTELVAGNPHSLKGNRLGQYALDLAGGWRLVFEPANDPIPRREDSSVDWSQVTIVSIDYIGDYHD